MDRMMNDKAKWKEGISEEPKEGSILYLSKHWQDDSGFIKSKCKYPH